MKKTLFFIAITLIIININIIFRENIKKNKGDESKPVNILNNPESLFGYKIDVFENSYLTSENPLMIFIEKNGAIIVSKNSKNINCNIYFSATKDTPFFMNIDSRDDTKLNNGQYPYYGVVNIDGNKASADGNVINFQYNLEYKNNKWTMKLGYSAKLVMPIKYFLIKNSGKSANFEIHDIKLDCL